LNLVKTTFLDDQIHEILVNDTTSVSEKDSGFLCKIQKEQESFLERERVFMYKAISKNVQKFKKGLSHLGVNVPTFIHSSTINPSNFVAFQSCHCFLSCAFHWLICYTIVIAIVVAILQPLR